MARKEHFVQNEISLGGRNGRARLVEYPGNQPIFDRYGGCGSHPLFKLLQTPPGGFGFVPTPSNPPTVPLNAIKWRAVQFAFKCWKKGASLKCVYKFLKTRDLESQRSIGQAGASLVFFPSVPFHLNQSPWMIEVEDSTSLFYPFLNNGSTKHTGTISRQRFFPIYDELVHSPQCKGIITHMKSTADSLPTIFNSPSLSKKVFHIPLGINLPDWTEVMKAKAKKEGEILILFANSWHQDPANFYLRGGLDVLETFSLIKRQCPAARLVIRSALPRDLAKKHPEHFKMTKEPGMEILDHFLKADEWERLKMSADYFILPSARIHVVSILEAMAYGMTLITSNGWGIEEYAKDNHNAVVVPGRDRVAWMDGDTGILREDYSLMFQTDRRIVEGMAKAVVYLNSDSSFKDKLTLQARSDVENIYSVHNWNQKLKAVLENIVLGETAADEEQIPASGGQRA